MFWDKASKRDKDRAIRAMAEIRAAQENDYNKTLQELMINVEGAHRGFVKELQRIHQSAANELQRINEKLQFIEHCANTVLNNGANLANNMSNEERRKAVINCRAKLDETFERIEMNRAIANRQATCEHKWEPHVTREAEDGYTNVIEAICPECSLVLEAPHNIITELEKIINQKEQVDAVH